MAAVDRGTDVKELLNSFIFSDESDLGVVASPRVSKESEDGNPRATKPRDRQAYLQRVHTFTSMNWFAKPLWLSPLVCARYGWENTGIDCLHCVSCGKYISGRIQPSSNPTVHEECCKRVADSLRTGHTLACPWANCPSPPHFLKISYDTPQAALQMFKERLSELALMKDRLPFLTDGTMDALDITPEQLNQLVEICNYTDDSDIKKSSSVLALTGWTTSSNCSDRTISCSVCKRHVGLWNFLSIANPEPVDEEGDRCEGPHELSADNVQISSSLINNLATEENQEKTQEPMLVEEEREKVAEENQLKSEKENREPNGVASEKDKEIGEQSDVSCSTKEDNSKGLNHSDQSEDLNLFLATGEEGTPEAENGPSVKVTGSGESSASVDDPLSKSSVEQNSIPQSGESVDQNIENTNIIGETSIEKESVSDDSKKQSDITSCYGVEKSDIKCNKEELPLTPDTEEPDTSGGALEKRIETENVTISDTSAHIKSPTVEDSMIRLDGPMLLDIAVGETDASTAEDTSEENERPVVSTPVKRPVVEEVEKGQPSTKKLKIQPKIQRTAFHPLIEHHTWCPWTSTSQPEYGNPPSTPSPRRQSSPDLPGWRQILYLLLPEFDPSWSNSIRIKANRTSPEALRSIRKLFNEWTSSDISR